jgi:hypothetical protein
MKCSIIEKLKHHNVNFNTDLIFVEKLYYEFCEELKQKYGELNAPFDNNKIIKRGKEWLDIHHICEIIADKNNGLDDVASRTTRAKKEKDTAELERLKQYNRVDQLVYANKIEHFVLHYLIDIYRDKDNGLHTPACWFLLANIFDIECKKDFKMPHLIEIQKNKGNYYTQEEFDYLFELAKILRNERNSPAYDYDLVIRLAISAVFISDIDRFCEMAGL